LGARAHQAEIRGAATDIANQNQIAVLHLVPDCVLVLRYPGIEGGKRFFQKGKRLDAGAVCRFHRELTSFFVERRWEERPSSIAGTLAPEPSERFSDFRNAAPPCLPRRQPSRDSTHSEDP
jgi:hypothetical protein